MHLNPDHFLQTEQGRVFTPERNAAAWEQLYAVLSSALTLAHRPVVLVVGVQGSGKSTWIERESTRSGDTIYIDATLATRERRARAIRIARDFGAPISAVWIKVALETALQRNRLRQADQIVPDFAIENVFQLFEAPTLDEGFDNVVIVDNHNTA
jgi:predicted kinase